MLPAVVHISANVSPLFRNFISVRTHRLYTYLSLYLTYKYFVCVNNLSLFIYLVEIKKYFKKLNYSVFYGRSLAKGRFVHVLTFLTIITSRIVFTDILKKTKCIIISTIALYIILALLIHFSARSSWENIKYTAARSEKFQNKCACSHACNVYQL